MKHIVECDEPDGGGVFKTVIDNPDAIQFATCVHARPWCGRSRSPKTRTNKPTLTLKRSTAGNIRFLAGSFYGYVAAPTRSIEAGSFTRGEFVNLLLSDVGQTLARWRDPGSLPLSADGGEGRTRQAKAPLIRS